MRNVLKKFAAAGLTAALGVSMLAGCGSKEAKIDGTKTAVTINDEAVSLGAVSFQARYQQAYMYQLYSMYFGSTEIFDQVVDESTEKTYGDQIKDSVLENIEELVLLKQHAADYDVEVSDEKKKELEAIAQAYIDENDEKVRAQIGASKEDVMYLLELLTIQDMMREPMVKDVDTEVADDEAQQTTVTYVSIAKKTEADLEADESDGDASAADESLSDESVSEEDKAKAVEEANKKLKADAEKILSDVKAAGNTKDADMGGIAIAVDESYTAATGQFTANDPTDTTLDASVVEAVADLKDGEVCDKVIETDSHYYVVRLDETFAKDETESKKEEIVKNRKTEAYNDLVEKWKEEAEITVDEKVMATLLITDSAPFTLGKDESVADESVSDESLADTATADSAAEELTDESATDESATDDSVTDESKADTSAADESK